VNNSDSVIFYFTDHGVFLIDPSRHVPARLCFNASAYQYL
jgi:hypothetical protein